MLSFGRFIHDRYDVFKSEEVSKEASEEFIAKWLQCLEGLESDKVSECQVFLKEIPDYFKANKFGFKHVMFFHNSMAYKINSLMKNMMHGEYIPLLSMEDIITEYNSLRDICDEFSLMVGEILGDGYAEAGYGTDVFEEMLKYINNNSSKSLSLVELGRQFNVSVSYICKQFRGRLNKTFLEYLISIRIDRAKQLFKNTSLSIMEVSEMVGYSDYYYFNKVFKAHAGYTPGRYKKFYTAASYKKSNK